MLTLVWSLMGEHAFDGEVWRRMDSVLFSDFGMAATEAKAGRKCSNQASMIEGTVVSWRMRAASNVVMVRGSYYLMRQRPLVASLAAAMVRTKSGMALELESTNPRPPCLTAI